MDIEKQKDSEASPPPESQNSALSQIAFLRGLTEIAREENLAELEVEQSGVRVSLRSFNADDYSLPPQMPSHYPIASDAVETPLLLLAQSTPAVAARDENLIEIVSPMVGVFYRAPSPADPNFIEIGDKIEIGQTVALVEAMKVFNEIVAEAAGTVVEIKAASTDLVETGQIIITLHS